MRAAFAALQLGQVRFRTNRLTDQFYLQVANILMDWDPNLGGRLASTPSTSAFSTPQPIPANTTVAIPAPGHVAPRVASIHTEWCSLLQIGWVSKQSALTPVPECQIPGYDCYEGGLHDKMVPSTGM